MKLYGGSWIIAGLVVLLALLTFPMWYGATATARPAFQSLPNPAGEKCIESREYMRDHHMQMLLQWRDDVVRGGDRVYVSRDGKRKWNKSLTGTCMACHDKADAHGKSLTAATYCPDCHAHVNVRLYCWDCRVDPVATPRVETPPTGVAMVSGEGGVHHD